MTTITVTTQAELDAALSRTDINYYSHEIVIDSPPGVWIKIADSRGLDVHASGTATVRAYGTATVRAYGTATVWAYGTATVHAYGTATVRASGTATVRAYGTATVWAYGTATVRAYGTATVWAYGTATVHAYGTATVWAYDTATVRAYGTATVHAYDTATVWAYDTATVWAYDTATVRAYGTATVRAYDTATVHASGTATVHAYGTATVRAYGTATVTATSHVAVHRHSARAAVTGGTLIDLSALDLTDPTTWATHTGAEITDDGHVILYKAVDQDLYAGRSYTPTRYPIGEIVTAPDWRPDHDCGHGLHASPHPHQALAYYPSAARMLRVAVPLELLHPIPGGGAAKAKAKSMLVEREVTLTGDDLPEIGDPQ